MPRSIPAPEHVYHVYVVRVQKRDELMNHLARHGIQTGIHYPVPIHLQLCYADLGHSEGSFEVTERLAREILSLPMYPEFVPAQIHGVVAAIEDFFTNSRG